MRTLLRLSLVVMLAGASALAPASAAHAADEPRVLALTAGHSDDETVEFALERLAMEARRWNFELVEGEPSDVEDLSGVDVVMLLDTEGDVFDAGQEAALQDFVEGGGGLVATHSAAVTEPDWAWWGETLGATATGEPIEPATEKPISFNDGSPITDGLDEELKLTERWYYFDPEPSETGQNILATLDSGDPAAWNSKDLKVFYSVAGGDHESWGERDFLQLIRQAIWWAAGEERALVQNADDAAPAWPYTLTFVLFVAAVAGGGSIAVWRLDRAETARAAEAGTEREAVSA
ncbi:ThuA domain-containing protein [Glycomyces arizonensis]|uniref:ThuA domain-containing protein n=1 Tax=Glycomyces arizonensis TaxID=256035 RepID=UPI0004026CAA|nr:ThuA domain-containing protein [Glycomyces arizonensis]